MKAINLEEVIRKNYSGFANKPKIIQKLLVSVLYKILYLKDLNKLLTKFPDHFGISFIDSVFDYLNFSYRISHLDYKRIPSEGRLICVSNHPIGSLDGLALLKAISEVRKDVRIVANDMLMNIENLTECFLPYKLDSKVAQKQNIIAIGNALENEEAVIIFPAAEVSRLKFYRIVDKRWTKGAIFFAKKFKAPILPIHVLAKNSLFFYFVSVLSRPISTMLLVREVFTKRNKIINILIGDPIPSKVFFESHINVNEQTKLLKKHVYALGNIFKRPVFVTEKNIIHPVDRQIIKKELKNSEHLGKTSDNKLIFLTDSKIAPDVIEEIARLREVTFRKVGEGTGKTKDVDIYDKHYKHIVVWDEEDLEIVGAYRVGIGKEIMKEIGYKGFYTATLFSFSEKLIKEFLPDSIEMGRSFVQKKYWNTNALHYLWQGIGAFLAKNPEVKYMFGPVSISNSYPDSAKELIIYYYSKWFGTNEDLAHSFSKYVLTDKAVRKLTDIFNGDNKMKDYKILKRMLKPYGFSVPVLYKHYSDLCEDEGVKFLDFGIDDSFEKCIDGLIVVDVSKVKKEKIERYIEPYLKKKNGSEKISDE